MQLTFTGPEAGERAGQYLSSAGFPEGRILDLTLFVWVLGMILRLPAIILAIGILGRVTRHGKSFAVIPYCWLFIFNRFRYIGRIMVLYGSA